MSWRRVKWVRTDGAGGAIGSATTGTAGQVLYWQDASLATSEAALAYDAATNVLTTGGLSTGAVAATSVTDSGLTSGRVVLASTGGLLADDAGLTYSGTTDTLTATRGELEAMNVTLTSVSPTTVSSVTPVLAKVGTITTVAGSALADGDYFTINDGSAYVFEFDLSPGDGVTAGRTAILFTAGDSADTVRDNVITAINGTAIQITASSGGAATVALESDTAGLPLGTNSENVGDAGFAVTGMSNPTAATAYGYKVVANFPNGGSTAASAAGSTAAGYATLGAKNLNRVVWSAVTGASTYTVYRTVGGATQGIIATVTAPAVSVDDTGLAGGGETAPTLTSTGKVTAAALTIPTGASAGYALTSDASGNASWQAAGGLSGLTTNRLLKATGATTAGNTDISEASAGSLATSAGTALGLTATAPAATTGASQAGIPVTITASPAVASTDTGGAAAGGSVTITAGDAARYSSGNGNGGDISLLTGAGIGAGARGLLRLSDHQIILMGSGTGGLGIANSSSGGGGIFYQTPISGSGGRLVLGTYATAYVGFASSATVTTSTAADTLWRRRAAANPAWGAASATPVSYVHSLAADSRSGTDTDVRGAKATLAPGVGTGTGGSGDLVIQTAPPGTTGTTANTLADRMVLASKPVTLTAGAATAVLDVAVAAGTVAGGTVWYTIRADDATDFQSLRGQVQWSAVNKGGTLTAAINTVGADILAESAGTSTLTVTPTITTGVGLVSINLNAVSSLTETTLHAFISAEIDGTGVATTK